MSPFCHSGVKLLWPFKRRSCFPGLKCGVTIATMGAASYMLDSSQNNWFLRYFRQAFTLKALSSFAWWKPPTRGVTRRCRGCGVPSDIWLNSRVLCVYMSVGWLTALSRGWAAMEGMTAFNEHQTLAPVPGHIRGKLLERWDSVLKPCFPLPIRFHGFIDLWPQV